LKKMIFASVTILLALLISFGFMEAVLRIIGYKPAYVNPLPAFHQGDPVLGWVGVPGFSARFKRGDFDVFISMNDEGFRKSECNIKPDPTARKIMFLGDSFTWGWGLEQGRVFTDILQDELGPGFHIINRGVNAYGTVQQKLLLEREIGAEKPTLVVLMFYLNDYDDNLDPDDLQRPYCSVDNGKVVVRNSPVLKPLGETYSPAIRISYAASLLTYYGDYFIRLAKRVLSSEKVRNRDITGLEPEIVAVADQVISEMKGICDSQGADFALLYVPSADEMESEDESVYLSTLKKICTAHDIELLDFVSTFKTAEAELKKKGESLFFRNDKHWTAGGHRLAASLLLDHIGQHPISR